MLKVLHLMLAINVLLSSTGVMVFEHLCQLRGKKVSYFVKPKSCCEKKQRIAACENDQPEAQLSCIPCCRDKSSFIKNDPNAAPLDLNALPLLNTVGTLPAQVVWRLTFDIVPLNLKELRFYQYKPPPQWRDIPVLVQSFRC